MTKEMLRLLTTKQVAEMLNLNPKTISNARYTGIGIVIPFLKLGGGVIRYKEADVMSFLEASEVSNG